MNESVAVEAKPVTATKPLIEMKDVGKRYGNIRALSGISLRARAGEITCVLGDNGAGKSTLIKIISGLHQHDEGELLVDGEDIRFTSPREALDRGIATVYQDLAVVALMPIWRNFFLGSEVRQPVSRGRLLDTGFMKTTSRSELLKMGIDLPDMDQPIGTLSGGQRQCVAIARAIYLGARVLILDEPTAALGVEQTAQVLDLIGRLRDRGLGVLLISHNLVDVRAVSDRVVVLRLGRNAAEFRTASATQEQIVAAITGAAL